MTEQQSTPTEEEILQELFDMCPKGRKKPFQRDNKPRVRELGQLLEEIGGHELMCDVRDQLPEEGQKDLEYVWRHIGEWD